MRNRAWVVALFVLIGCGSTAKECTVETEQAVCGQSNGTPVKRSDGTYAGCCCFSAPPYANEACCLRNEGTWKGVNGCDTSSP